MSAGAYGFDMRPQQPRHFRLAVPSDQGDLAHLAVRIDHVQDPHELLCVRAGPDFDADGILEPAKVLDVRPLELSRAVADPEEVRRGVVPCFAVVILIPTLIPVLIGGGGRRRRGLTSIMAMMIVRRSSEPSRQSLFVLQEQALVAGVEIHCVKLSGRVGPDGLHESKRVRDRRDDALVLGFDAGRFHMAEVPIERRVEVGDPRRELRADVVQRRGRMEVGAVSVNLPSASAVLPKLDADEESSDLTRRDGSGTRSEGS